MTPSTMIEADGLEKHFGDVHAVDGISFSVSRGGDLGLLGHNGAGKTTTIRMLTGRTGPTSGTALIAGFDVEHQLDQVKPLINLVFEEPNLYERLTRYERTCASSRSLWRISETGRGSTRARRLRASGRPQSENVFERHEAAATSIARALVNEPRLLFLDEPTRGLDPTSARELRDLVAELSRQGTTVFLTTHYMEEADELCHRVAFLSQGKIVAVDQPRELKLRFGQRTAVVLLKNREEKTVRLDDSADAERLARWMGRRETS